MMATMHYYLSLRLGQYWYGIEVENILEVLHLMALTELPAAPSDVLGLLRVRDLVLPVIDLRLRFGLKDAPLHLNTPIIAVRTANNVVGLVVDEVDDIVPISTAQLADCDDTGSPYVMAVAKSPERLLLLLDLATFHVELPEPA